MQTKTAFAKFRSNNGQKPKRKLDDVAALFGVNKTTILRWEKGEVMLPMSRLKEFEEITGIPRRDLRPDLYEAMES